MCEMHTAVESKWRKEVIYYKFTMLLLIYGNPGKQILMHTARMDFKRDVYA